MQHVIRYCPVCKHKIKLTYYSWKYLENYVCTHCGTHLQKYFSTWGGISGFALKEVI